MMLNCFGIDKLLGFMMHNVMLAVCHILHENDYSFQFSNVGSYDIQSGSIIPRSVITQNRISRNQTLDPETWNPCQSIFTKKGHEICN